MLATEKQRLIWSLFSFSFRENYALWQSMEYKTEELCKLSSNCSANKYIINVIVYNLVIFWNYII